VLLSTSYLDEAERCDRVIVMHQGKLLAEGNPSDVSELAAGGVFLATPPAGQKAREFQARLLDHPGVIDAVPEGGRVRFVRAADTDPSAGREISFDDVVATPVPPRFEDGFCFYSRQGTRRQTRSKKTDKETRQGKQTRRQGQKESKR
jgi:ABC-2 type transport system ATP-binding protein